MTCNYMYYGVIKFEIIISFYISTDEFLYVPWNCISGVMDKYSIVASSVVDLVFEPWSYQTKHYQIGIAASHLSKQSALIIYMYIFLYIIKNLRKD